MLSLLFLEESGATAPTVPTVEKKSHKRTGLIAKLFALIKGWFD